MSTRRRAVLTAIVAVAVGASALFVFNATREAISGEARAEMVRRTLVHDGIEREFFVHVPYGKDESLPVVLALHGYTSTATGFQAAHDLNAHADKSGYIIVYPQGSHFVAEDPDGGPYRVTSWNDLAANLGLKAEGPHCTADAFEYPCPPECGACDRCSWTSCYDDVGFIDRLLDVVHAEFGTDETRTYVLGVSNGAMLALRLGCSRAERFAAVAPIIGQLAPGYACSPAVDLPMLHLYGGKDDTVRFDGQPAGDGFLYTTAESTARVWAGSLACEAGPEAWANATSVEAGLTCTAYSDCRVPGHEVVSCMDPDAGHEWPKQGIPGISATCVTAEQYEAMPDQPRCPPAASAGLTLGMDLVWSFFERY